MIGWLRKNSKEDNVIYSPAVGKLGALENSKDPVFATKTMGEGFLVLSSEEEVYAPITGQVVSIFPTGHAYGIINDKGLEVMVHIGVDTVNLRDETFDPCVRVGQHVKVCDLLCKFNREELKRSGIAPEIYVFVTNSDNFEFEYLLEDGYVDERKAILKWREKI